MIKLFRYNRTRMSSGFVTEAEVEEKKIKRQVETKYQPYSKGYKQGWPDSQ